MTRTSLRRLALLVMLSVSLLLLSREFQAARAVDDIECEWQRIKTSQLGVWSPASAMDTDTHAMYVFGGLTKDLEVSKQIEKVDLKSPKLDQVSLSQIRGATSGAYGAAGAYRAKGANFSESAVYFVGGSTVADSGKGSDQVIRVNDDSAHMVTLTNAEKLTKRLWAAAAYDPIHDVIWVTGGTRQCSFKDAIDAKCRAEPLDTIWISWSISNEPEVHQLTNGELSMFGHRMIFDETARRMIILGGTTDGADATKLIRVLDLSKPDPGAASIRKFEVDSTPNVAFGGFASWPSRHLAIVAGGAKTEVFRAKEADQKTTSILDLGDVSTPKWSAYIWKADRSSDRVGAVLEYDNRHDAMILHSGRAKIDKNLVDLLGSPLADVTIDRNIEALTCKGGEQSPTNTPMSTATPTVGSTATVTNTVSASPTSTSSPTPTATATTTATASSSRTRTLTPTPLFTPEPDATATAAPSATLRVPVPRRAFMPFIGRAPTPTATAIPTSTPTLVPPVRREIEGSGLIRLASCGNSSQVIVSRGSTLFRLSLSPVGKAEAIYQFSSNEVITDVEVKDDDCNFVLAAVWTRGVASVDVAKHESRFFTDPGKFVYELQMHKEGLYAVSSQTLGESGGLYHAALDSDARPRSWEHVGSMSLDGRNLLVITGGMNQDKSDYAFVGTTSGALQFQRLSSQSEWRVAHIAELEGKTVWGMMDDASNRESGSYSSGLNLVGVRGEGLLRRTSKSTTWQKDQDINQSTVRSITYDGGVFVASSVTQGIWFGSRLEGPWKRLSAVSNVTYQAMQAGGRLIVAAEDGVWIFPVAKNWLR